MAEGAPQDPPFSYRRFSSREELVEAAVSRFLTVVEEHAPARLALATGRTYVPFYERLAGVVDAGQRTALGLARGFNLDELVLPPGHPSSFASYMERHVFAPASLEREHFVIPAPPASGSSPSEAGLEEVCRDYDRTIEPFQPVDLALLGLGVDGHVAYNLPGPPREETHAVELSDELARELGAPDDYRPLRALTVGFGPLRSARRILVLATGESKAEAVARLVEGPQDERWPCTLLRDHPGLELLVDEDASP